MDTDIRALLVPYYYTVSFYVELVLALRSVLICALQTITSHEDKYFRATNFINNLNFGTEEIYRGVSSMSSIISTR